MSKKTIIAALAILTVSTFSIANTAQAYPDSNNGHGKYHQNYDNDNKNYKGQGRGNREQRAEQMQEIKKQFESLSAEQKNALEKMTDEHRKEMNPIDTNLAMKHAEYRALMQNSNPNPKEAGRLAGDISKLQQQKEELREQYRDEVEEKFGLDLPMGRGFGKQGRGDGHFGFGEGRGRGHCPF